MANKRDRYVISGRMSANGKDLRGIVVVDLGPCGASGGTTNRDGKKLLKRDLTHKKFKFEDPKSGRELGLPKDLCEFYLRPEHVSVFLTKQEGTNT